MVGVLYIMSITNTGLVPKVYKLATVTAWNIEQTIKVRLPVQHDFPDYIENQLVMLIYPKYFSGCIS
jgi:hypothetical protein